MNDPRYVAIVDQPIPNAEDVWVKGTDLQPGEKALVIYTKTQVRLYPLTDERRSGGKPIKFRVGPDSNIRASDHVIHQENGITVYVPVEARVDRIRWALDKMRPTSLLDHLDVITELQHLICHRAITERQQIDGPEYERFHYFLRRMTDATDSSFRFSAAEEALFLGKKLARYTNGGS